MVLQLAFGLCLILLLFAFFNVGARSRGASSVVMRRQRRIADQSATRSRLASHREADLDAEPEITSSILAHPRVRKALDEGRVLDATRHVRIITGLDPQVALRMVERHTAR